jgi:cytochrome c peroxidase
LALVGVAAAAVVAAVLVGLERRPEPDPLDPALRSLIAEQRLEPIAAVDHPAPLVELGRALFFDPELSGNRDVSCATCHHPAEASGDGLLVSVGTGGIGTGSERTPGEGRRLIARNATEIYNRGAAEWVTMFWDGRVSIGRDGTLATPAGDELPGGIDGVLAAQAMFPVTSRDEMRGSEEDAAAGNELAVIDDDDFPEIWDALMQRLAAIPGYRDLLAAAFPDTPDGAWRFEQAAEAIAAFEAEAFTFTQSPWDRYLRGDDGAIGEAEKRGALLFFGDAGCGSCHMGPLLTDQGYHNMAVPQVGPGREGDAPRDFGRARASGRSEDRYSFRTPPLRNVTLTGPWMHDGAYDDLEAAVRHHLDPVGALTAYDPARLPPEVAAAHDVPLERLHEQILAFLPDRAPVSLDDAQIADLLAFLGALTDPAAADLDHLVPEQVPSGLPIDL